MLHHYFNKLPSSSSSANSPLAEGSARSNTEPVQPQGPPQEPPPCRGKNAIPIGRGEVDLNALPSDPGERTPISFYHPNDRDEVRRAYIQKGPYQPRNHSYRTKLMSGKLRKFNESWFDQYANWLEYSIKEDAVFCLCCYLFKNESENTRHFGGDSFTVKGFNSWNKLKERLALYVGETSSVHNHCVRRCDELMLQKQSIQVALDKQSEKVKSEYHTRLNASIDVVRWLLSEGLPFRGHDKSESSKKKGHFLSLLNFHAQSNDDVRKVILGNAPGNNQMVAHSIQKEIANACCKETTKAIIKEIGDGYFCILVDESRDCSCKQQLALVLRFVDEKGFIMERLVGLNHVSNTTSASLKEVIYSMLAQLSLSPSRIRGQGYDGASNMRGHVNGLRSLIMKDCPSAHYVYCFAHQLQLTLVTVAHKHNDVICLIDTITIVLNLIGKSYQLRDELREKQAARVEEALNLGEIHTGKGLHQEVGLLRPGDTRWGSYYRTFKNFIVIYGSIVDVLGALHLSANTQVDQVRAASALDKIQTFEFVFLVHFMFLVLGITNALSLALQRRDQDIANALSLLDSSKNELQRIRDEGWDSLIEDVNSFCLKYDIPIPSLDDLYTFPGHRAKRRVSTITNCHYFRVDVFNTIIDMQMQELNSRFPETSTDLLLGVHCLMPGQLFTNMEKGKILKMARLYPDDFSDSEIEDLRVELDSFVANVRHDERFTNLSGLGELCRKLIQTKKHLSFPQLYILFKLALILPVSTATVERVFSAMKLIKTDLRNKIGDEFLNDTVVTYYNDDLFERVSNDDIINRFQMMKTRRSQLR